MTPHQMDVLWTIQIALDVAYSSWIFYVVWHKFVHRHHDDDHRHLVRWRDGDVVTTTQTTQKTTTQTTQKTTTK